MTAAQRPVRGSDDAAGAHARLHSRRCHRPQRTPACDGPVDVPADGNAQPEALAQQRLTWRPRVSNGSPPAAGHGAGRSGWVPGPVRAVARHATLPVRSAARLATLPVRYSRNPRLPCECTACHVHSVIMSDWSDPVLARRRTLELSSAILQRWDAVLMCYLTSNQLALRPSGSTWPRHEKADHSRQTPVGSSIDGEPGSSTQTSGLGRAATSSRRAAGTRGESGCFSSFTACRHTG